MCTSQVPNLLQFAACLKSHALTPAPPQTGQPCLCNCAQGATAWGLKCVSSCWWPQTPTAAPSLMAAVHAQGMQLWWQCLWGC